MSVKTICYLCGGYPSVQRSMEMAEYYIEAGCDAIEVSMPPKDPYRDGAFIQDLMRKALAGCADYDVYLDAIRGLAKKHPETELILLLYHEVIMSIGGEKLAAFCEEIGVKYIISGDLHDPDALAAFRAHGVKLARSVNYKMNEDDIQRCIETDGFTYMQAFLTPGQQAKPGFEELSTCLRYLRERKVSEPIYCGAGITGPDDARRVKEAGGNGFFVGSSIIKLYDEPEKLVALIREYKKAVAD